MSSKQGDQYQSLLEELFNFIGDQKSVLQENQRTVAHSIFIALTNIVGAKSSADQLIRCLTLVEDDDRKKSLLLDAYRPQCLETDVIEREEQI